MSFYKTTIQIIENDSVVNTFEGNSYKLTQLFDYNEYMHSLEKSVLQTIRLLLPDNTVIQGQDDITKYILNNNISGTLNIKKVISNEDVTLHFTNYDITGLSVPTELTSSSTQILYIVTFYSVNVYVSNEYINKENYSEKGWMISSGVKQVNDAYNLIKNSKNNTGDISAFNEIYVYLDSTVKTGNLKFSFTSAENENAASEKKVPYSFGDVVNVPTNYNELNDVFNKELTDSMKMMVDDPTQPENLTYNIEYIYNDITYSMGDEINTVEIPKKSNQSYITLNYVPKMINYDRNIQNTNLDVIGRNFEETVELTSDDFTFTENPSRTYLSVAVNGYKLSKIDNVISSSSYVARVYKTYTSKKAIFHTYLSPNNFFKGRGRDEHDLEAIKDDDVTFYNYIGESLTKENRDKIIDFIIEKGIMKSGSSDNYLMSLEYQDNEFIDIPRFRGIGNYVTSISQIQKYSELHPSAKHVFYYYGQETVPTYDDMLVINCEKKYKGAYKDNDTGYFYDESLARINVDESKIVFENGTIEKTINPMLSNLYKIFDRNIITMSAAGSYDENRILFINSIYTSSNSSIMIPSKDAYKYYNQQKFYVHFFTTNGQHINYLIDTDNVQTNEYGEKYLECNLSKKETFSQGGSTQSVMLVDKFQVISNDGIAENRASNCFYYTSGGNIEMMYGSNSYRVYSISSIKVLENGLIKIYVNYISDSSSSYGYPLEDGIYIGLIGNTSLYKTFTPKELVHCVVEADGVTEYIEPTE